MNHPYRYFFWALLGSVCLAGCSDTVGFLNSGKAATPESGATGTSTGTTTGTTTGSTTPVIRHATIPVIAHELRAPVKIALLVNTSASMTREIATLGDGLGSLVTSLAGFNASFYVFSNQTSTLGSLVSSESATRYVADDGHVTTSRPSTYPYTVEVSLSAAPPVLSAQLPQNPSPDDIAQTQTQLRAALAQANKANGSLQFSTCSLLRQLEQSTNGTFSAGDSAAFLVLTNRDEAAKSGDCLKGYSHPVTGLGAVQHIARVSLDAQQLNFNVLKLGVDASGNLIKQPVATSVTVWDTANCLSNGACSAAADTTAKACTTSADGAKNQVAYLTGQYGGAEITDCTVKRITAANDFNFDSTVVSCTDPFSYKGTSYTNMADYVTKAGYGYANGCTLRTSQGTVNGPKEISYFHTTSTPAARFDDEPAYYREIGSKAKALFGDTGYFLSAIEHASDLDAAASCPALQPGESYGVTLQNFLTALGFGDHRAAICSPDYSASLNQISRFVHEVVQNRYAIPDYVAGETVLKVSVRDGAATVDLDPSQYQVLGGTLEVMATVDIPSTGSLLVELLEP